MTNDNYFGRKQSLEIVQINTGPEKLTIKAEDIKGTYVSNMTKGIGLLTKIATSIELLWYFQKQLQLSVHSGSNLNGLQVVILSKICYRVANDRVTWDPWWNGEDKISTMNVHLVT